MPLWLENPPCPRSRWEISVGCHPGYTDCKDPISCPTALTWWGFVNAAEKDRIESVINKAQRYGYLPSSFENVHSLVDNMESKLFNCILSNPRHVLYQLLPPEKDTGYNLRQRSHHLTVPFTDNNMIRKNFLHRMLFTDTY